MFRRTFQFRRPAPTMFIAALTSIKEYKLNHKEIPKVVPGEVNPSNGWYATPHRDIEALIEHTNKMTESHLFLRSDIGSGKSSLIQTLQYVNDNVVVLTMSPTKDEQKWEELFVKYAVWKPQPKDLSVGTVRPHLDGKIVLIDECHLFFGLVSDLSFFTKSETGRTFTLFTSSAAAHIAAQRKQLILATPALITNKKYFQLSFTEDDVSDLVKTLRFSLVAAIVAMLWSLFSGHLRTF